MNLSPESFVRRLLSFTHHESNTPGDCMFDFNVNTLFYLLTDLMNWVGCSCPDVSVIPPRKGQPRGDKHYRRRESRSRWWSVGFQTSHLVTFWELPNVKQHIPQLDAVFIHVTCPPSVLERLICASCDPVLACFFFAAHNLILIINFEEEVSKFPIKIRRSPFKKRNTWRKPSLPGCWFISTNAS